MNRRGWLLFGALGVLWGVPYLMIRVAVVDLDPLMVAFGRCLIAALLLLPLAARAGTLSLPLRRWRPLVAFTLVEICGPWLLLGHAETRINSSTAGLMIAVVPLLAAVIVARLGDDHLDRRRVGGLALGFAGVAAPVGLDIQGGDLMAVGAIGLTALGYAVGPIIITRHLADVPPLAVIACSVTLATVVYAPFVPLTWPRHAVPADALWAVAGLGVICTALAFVLFFALVAEVGPARTVVITYLNPAVAVGLGIAVLAEPFTTGMMLGFPLVLAGSILATSKARPAVVEPVAVGAAS